MAAHDRRRLEVGRVTHPSTSWQPEVVFYMALFAFVVGFGAVVLTLVDRIAWI